MNWLRNNRAMMVEVLRWLGRKATILQQGTIVR